MKIAHLTDELDIEEILRDVNEDRSISGFPEVSNIDFIETELQERKRYYRNAIKDGLNRLPPKTLVSVMTETVDNATGNGEQQAPELIDQLVDSYQVESQGFLQIEAESIQKLITSISANAPSGEAVIEPLIDKLIGVTRNWDMVAQPIQLSVKSRGIDHQASNEVAYTIRNLAIELVNKYELLPQSKRLIELLQELFSELPELIETVDNDADALENIFHDRSQAEEESIQWAKEITYSTEIGAIFKDKLSISSDGIIWKNKTFPLDKISHVRWGGVRRSINGIPSGTTYTIAFGNNRDEAVIDTSKELIYSTFIDKLWRAVCSRLLSEMLGALGEGKELRFGSAKIRDDGVTLTKVKFLGADEIRSFNWSEVKIWSAGGEFVLGAVNDKKFSAEMSYIDVPNVHVLELAIRILFKSTSKRRLSELLDGT